MIRATALAALLAAQGGDFAREGDGDRRKALDAMEGKPAPEIEAEAWLSGEATTLRKLEGKVVLLDFWGTW
jgi:hypothetical protein